MEKNDFEKLVREAVMSLPEHIREKMENVAIIIEENPTQEQLRKTGVRYGGILFGQYEGIPQSTLP